MTRKTCSFRFLKQNPPLKMYLQTFLCHRLILDIARIRTFPGLTAPSPGGGGWPPSPRPPLRVPRQARGPDQWPLHTKARHSRGFFKTSMSVAAVTSILWKRGPSAEPGPRGASRSRSVHLPLSLGDAECRSWGLQRRLSREKGQIPPRGAKVGTARPHLTSFYRMPPHPQGPGGGTRTGKTNERLHNTEPETKIHDRYHECPLGTPRTHR